MAPANVQAAYRKAKIDGLQPLCPYCGALLEIGQSHIETLYWSWDETRKMFTQNTSNGGDAAKPFCRACGTADWDFIDFNLVDFS
jgi:hypothetical protein